jgi:hypothetical protein
LVPLLRQRVYALALGYEDLPKRSRLASERSAPVGGRWEAGPNRRESLSQT